MTYRVLLTDRAIHDLEQACAWYMERSPKNAVRWYHGFIDAINGLEANPERCPIAPEAHKLSLEVRQLLYGRELSYCALFLVRAETVIVLHIRHASRRNASPDELAEPETQS